MKKTFVFATLLFTLHLIINYRFLWADWLIETVDSKGVVGGGTSIALDTNGCPHISYWDWTNGDLKYARWNTSPTLNWTGETNYTSDGLHPERGLSTDTFVYRIKYIDYENDPPASGYPKVHILKGGY